MRAGLRSTSASCFRSPRARLLVALLAALASAACGDPKGTVAPGNGQGNPGDGDAKGDGDGDGDPAGDGDGDGDGDAEPDVPGDQPLDAPYAVDQCGADNPAGLSADKLGKLMAGGSSTGMRVLYPYEGTVFPRGLKAPLMMWDGSNADAIYLHISAKGFDYKGCLKPTANGRIQIPANVWTQAGARTQGPAEPFSIELSFLSGDTARGPLTRKLVIANATLSGSIFYNSYETSGGGFGGGGAIQRIQPGKDAAQFARQGTCTGCHSVSANGSRLVASEATGITGTGSVYQIAPMTPANPAPSHGIASGSFVGISPDGSVYVSSASSLTVGPLLNGGVLPPAAASSGLYETDSGNAVNNSGIPTTAMMPTFSPDGNLLVFNDNAQSSGHALSLMDYDAKNRKVANARSIYSHATLYPGWPFLLPDNGGAVFALGSDSAFDGNGVGISAAIARGPESDIYVVDVKSKQATLLAKAMGFDKVADASSNKTYLPFGSEELHQAYYPTVSPVASGGYFWIFFDSMRHYGNQGFKRQLWGSALKVSADGKYTGDPSSPAFYVSGQDFDTSNHRAFTALDPCKKDGDGCRSGADCCGGYCNFPPAGEFTVDQLGMCSSTKQECAKDGERCSDVSDCCGEATQCINRYCGDVILL
ncbi:MAG: hypothetical protein QM778_30450 [Myxococcales bacterium]